MYLKLKDIHYFNVDEIEIYGTFSNYITLLKGINDSNSDFIIFEDFTLKKSDKLKDYNFKVDFIKDNLPCFAFYIGKKINYKMTTRDYFKVYGSAFQVMELKYIINFINTYIELDYKDIINNNKHNTLKRFDIAIDIKKEISNGIIKNFSELKQKGTQYYGTNGELETYYIGEYKKKINKRLLIRIYDKIKDIKGKGKQKIYPSYLIEKNITRLEIEFRSELIKYITIDKLLDRDYIFNLFIKYIEKHTNIFDKVKTKDVKKLKRLNKKMNIDDLKYNLVIRERYINTFLGYSENIKKIGKCPVDILLQNGIIQKKTISDISSSFRNNKFNLKTYKILFICLHEINDVLYLNNKDKDE